MHRSYLENDWCPKNINIAFEIVFSGLEVMLSWIVYSLGAWAAVVIPFIAFSSLSSSFYLCKAGKLYEKP